MNIIKLAAFSDGNSGGNPAGVAILETMPSPTEMQSIAAEVGFSETVFAERLTDKHSWRVRYFSPESEVPFCGHATIALDAALANAHGEGQYQLTLNNALITVDGKRDGDQFIATLQSPVTRHELMSDDELQATLSLFGYSLDQVSEQIAPARIHAGADHYLVVLKSRKDLAAMNYELAVGRDFMRARGLITIMFAVTAPNQVFHVRNAFASGGVLEDPATGAAAAAFSGYLRDSGWPHTGMIELIQGEDMGERSLITADFSSEAGSSIRVSSATRNLDECRA